METTTTVSVPQEEANTSATSKEREAQSLSSVPLQQEEQPKIIKRDPIIREYQAKPIVTEIIERPIIEVRYRTLIKEFHEKPIVEFRQELVGENVVQEQPVYKTIRHEPIHVYSREEEDKLVEELKKKGYNVIIHDANPKEIQVEQLPPVHVSILQQPQHLTMTRTVDEYKKTEGSGVETSRLEQRAEIPLRNPLEATLVEQAKQIETRPVVVDTSRVTHQSIHPIQVIPQQLNEQNIQQGATIVSSQQMPEPIAQRSFTISQKPEVAASTVTTSNVEPSIVATSIAAIGEKPAIVEKPITAKPRKAGALSKLMRKLGLSNAPKAK